MRGREKTVYENKIIRCLIKFPLDYPKKPPQVLFQVIYIYIYKFICYLFIKFKY